MPSFADDYEILGELGRGAMGRVYRARQRSTGAVRALKVLSADLDPETLERFRREGEALARVGGPGVVRIHEAGRGPSGPYLVMELVSGGSLRERLARQGRLPWPEAARIALSLASTLERCHGAGLVHRDLKPENVLLDEQGEPRLADFGCVRDVLGERLTRTGDVLGTPAYMAPEQLSGERATAQADVFALGAILHELVSGERPFAGNNWQGILFAIQRGERRSLVVSAGAPRALEAAVARALEALPARRTPSAAELALDLERALAGGSTKPRRRGLAAGLAAGGVLAAGALALALVLVTRGSAPTPATPPLASPSPALDPAADAAPIARRVLEATAGTLTTGSVPASDLRALVRAGRWDAIRRLADAGLVYPFEAVAPVAAVSSDRGLAELVAFSRLVARPEERVAAGAALAPYVTALSLGVADLARLADRFAGKLSLGSSDAERMQVCAEFRGELARIGSLAHRAGPILGDAALAPLTSLVRVSAKMTYLERELREFDGSLMTLSSAIRNVFRSKPSPVGLPPRWCAAVSIVCWHEPTDDWVAQTDALDGTAALVDSSDPLLGVACTLYSARVRFDRGHVERGTSLPVGAIEERLHRTLALPLATVAPEDRDWLRALKREAWMVERQLTRWRVSHAEPAASATPEEYVAAARREMAASDPEPGSLLDFHTSRAVTASAFVQALLELGHETALDPELRALEDALDEDDYLRAILRLQLGDVASARGRLERVSSAHPGMRKGDAVEDGTFAGIAATRALVRAIDGDLEGARDALDRARSTTRGGVEIPLIAIDEVQAFIDARARAR